MTAILVIDWVAYLRAAAATWKDKQIVQIIYGEYIFNSLLNKPQMASVLARGMFVHFHSG